MQKDQYVKIIEENLLISTSSSEAFISSEVYKFKSTETDVEKPREEVYTKYEVSYHTFNLNKKEVTFESIKSNGEKTKIIYQIKNSYKDGVTYVFIVNDKGVKEIWFSPEMNNLGYDLIDGTRLAFYNITKVN